MTGLNLKGRQTAGLAVKHKPDSLDGVDHHCDDV